MGFGFREQTKARRRIGLKIPGAIQAARRLQAGKLMNQSNNGAMSSAWEPRLAAAPFSLTSLPDEVLRSQRTQNPKPERPQKRLGCRLGTPGITPLLPFLQS